MEPLQGTILVIDDDEGVRDVLADRLESMGHRVLTAPNGRRGLTILEEQSPHIVFLDIEMPEMSGLAVLAEIRQKNLDATVVMITAYATVERAVEAMKEGAYDFLQKPFEPDHIARLVSKALERDSLKRGVGILSEEAAERYRMILGASPKMRGVVDTARKVAASKSTALLLGESGTGKEVLARAIHSWSDRKDNSFVAINCVGLSGELLGSELFGHERGAFTGAHGLKRGKLELAHGGTVFLDEVGDIGPEVQTKLLRFLQEREFERVGGTKPIRVDIRIVAATNRDLEKAVNDGLFRLDLYHRLNVVPIKLPPLRERVEDIPALTEFFLKRFAAEAKKQFTGIDGDAVKLLQSYHWPGNVRELANVIERAVVLGHGPTLTVTDLGPPIDEADLESRVSKAELGAAVFSYRDAIDLAKRETIQKALDQTEWNRAEAAKLLGVERAYLSKLMKSLGLR